jgi:predicted nuclease with TOPRIM domain
MGWLADLLKEIPSSATLTAKLEEAQAKYDKLEGELARCKEQNAWLRAEVDKHLKPAELDEVETKILVHLAGVIGRHLAEHVGLVFEMGTAKTEHYLSKLEKNGYVHGSMSMGGGPARYSLADKGREYLVTHDPIK